MRRASGAEKIQVSTTAVEMPTATPSGTDRGISAPETSTDMAAAASAVRNSLARNVTVGPRSAGAGVLDVQMVLEVLIVLVLRVHCLHRRREHLQHLRHLRHQHL